MDSLTLESRTELSPTPQTQRHALTEAPTPSRTGFGGGPPGGNQVWMRGRPSRWDQEGTQDLSPSLSHMRTDSSVNKEAGPHRDPKLGLVSLQSMNPCCLSPQATGPCQVSPGPLTSLVTGSWTRGATLTFLFRRHSTFTRTRKEKKACLFSDNLTVLCTDQLQREETEGISLS